MVALPRNTKTKRKQNLSCTISNENAVIVGEHNSEREDEKRRTWQKFRDADCNHSMRCWFMDNIAFLEIQGFVCV